MTTRTDEIISSKERIDELVAHRREEGSEVKSFSEPEPTKPLVAFDVLPARVARPSNW